MSLSKTEKATPKKKRDAARRGQMFKARDLVVSCMLLCAGVYLVARSSLFPLGALLAEAIRSGFETDPWSYAVAVFVRACGIVLPLMLVAAIATAMCSLLQSGFQLATEAVRIDFNAINPARGFKRIFSVRTAKDAVKSLCYLAAFGLALLLVAWADREQVYVQVYASPPGIIAIWRRLALHLLLAVLLCILAIVLLDGMAEWFLYLKDLRMDKREVRQERKEMEGDPLIKGERRQRHIDLLSAQERHDIEHSRMIVANPTHIAIGVYFKPEISPVPMVSVRAANQRALAVRRYAEQVGVPVMVDIPLARRMYRSHRCYEPVSMDEIYPVVHLLLWLQQIEEAGRAEDHAEVIDPS